MPHRNQPPISFASLATDSPDIVARYDRNLRHLYVNAVITGLTGRQPEEFIGKTNRELGMPLHLSEQWENLLTEVFETGEPRATDFSFETSHGLRYFHARLIPERNDQGQIISVLSIAADQTDRQLAQEALRVQEATLRSFYESSPISMGIVELAGNNIRHIYDNPAACRFFGMEPNSTQGKLATELGADEYTISTWIRHYRDALWENRPVQFDFPTDQTPDCRWLGVTVAPIETEPTRMPRCSYIAEDITDRKRTEATLAELNRELENRVERRTHQLAEANHKILASLREKEVLLKEVHHRVKNNLQIVSSLLRMHLGRYEGTDLVSILQESHMRIQSMAMIHEQLYQGDDMSEIQFKSYLEILVPRLAHSYTRNQQPVSYQLDVQNIALPIDVAIPCALIAVELISNAFKYAFHGSMGDRLLIHFSLNPEGMVCLGVEDNGPGLPAGFDWRDVSSLGFTIIQALSRQLKGDLTATAGASGGTKFTLCFSIDSVPRTLVPTPSRP